MFTSASTRAASVYKKVAAETSVQGADPHQLVDLLFDALLQSLASAPVTSRPRARPSARPCASSKKA